MTGDNRVLRVTRLVVTNGNPTYQIGAQVRQDSDGRIIGSGLWFEQLVPSQDDLMAQAEAKNISTLEWLRQKLEMITYLKLEIFQ